jgi:N-acetyl-gamma-glutamyl-phosphate reductase
VSERWPTLVLGGSGYVAGELIRLTAGHPDLDLRAAMSSSLPGQPVAESFPHLLPAVGELRFDDLDGVLGQFQPDEHWAVLAAAPHLISAPLLERVVDAARAAGTRLSLVDASADFRFSDAEAFRSVYGEPHGAPDLLGQFHCALPEHTKVVTTPYISHPGCFATAMLLGIVPLAAAGISENRFFVTGVTGSTGSGRSPKPTTHHPERQSNMFAYKPLQHRHAPEVRALASATAKTDIALHFVPHSGPFARGIHATIHAPLKQATSAAALRELLVEYYRGAHFVRVSEGMPRLKDVAGSNYAALGVATDDRSAVIVCVIDNLLKGAAGGAVQWLNRLLGIPEQRGLETPAIGWL